MFVTCGIWRLADVSSVSPSSEQTGELWANQWNLEICGIYLHLGNNETRKRKEQRLIFKLGTLAPNGINERFSFP